MFKCDFVLFAFQMLVMLFLILCGELGSIWIKKSCGWNRISREIQMSMLVCKGVRTPYWLIS